MVAEYRGMIYCQMRQHLDISGFRMIVPVRVPAPRYVLVVDKLEKIQTESLKKEMEERLSENPQYAYARRMGQLDGLSVYSLPNPLTSYTKRAVSNGMRIGELKVPALRPETDWLETFLEEVK